jgi:hypothetical protein
VTIREIIEEEFPCDPTCLNGCDEKKGVHCATCWAASRDRAERVVRRVLEMAAERNEAWADWLDAESPGEAVKAKGIRAAARQDRALAASLEGRPK